MTNQEPTLNPTGPKSDGMQAKRLSFDTTAAGLEHLQRTLASNPVGPQPPTKGLPVSAITICETVFQRRDLQLNRWQREDHVKDLKRGIQEDPDQMEPISVWWGGDGWYLVDGHHRMLAYESLGFTGRIPVRVVSGSLQDALAFVGTANTRNKLPMTKDERMNLAVFYECVAPGMSLREIARHSGVSKSQVSTIKNTLALLVEKGQTREELMELSWDEIRRLSRGDNTADFDFDQEKQMKTQEIREALAPLLGKKPQRHVEALGDAIRQLSPALWSALVDQFGPSGDAFDELEDAEY